MMWEVELCTQVRGGWILGYKHTMRTTEGGGGSGFIDGRTAMEFSDLRGDDDLGTNFLSGY